MNLRPPICRWAAATLLLWFLGCAPLDWQKPGVTEAEIDRDYARCAAQARSEMLRQMPIMQPAPQLIVDQQGRVVTVQTRNHDSERFFLEQNRLRQCMAALDYTLQPKDASASTITNPKRP